MNIRALILGIVISSAVTSAAFAQSATPTEQTKLAVTWEARNLYPSTYLGKVFPSTGSIVDMSIVASLGGKLVDLSRALITWRVDESVIARTEGLQNISFTSQKQSGTSHFVRVVVEPVGGGSYEVIARVPVVDPKIVIRQSGTGSEVTLRAIPYFFNAPDLSDLNFSWSVAGKKSEKAGDNLLTIGADSGLSGSKLRVDLAVNNLANPLEFAKTWLNL